MLFYNYNITNYLGRPGGHTLMLLSVRNVMFCSYELKHLNISDASHVASLKPTEPLGIQHNCSFSSPCIPSAIRATPGAWYTSQKERRCKPHRHYNNVVYNLCKCSNTVATLSRLDAIIQSNRTD